MLRLLGYVDKLERAITASAFACGLPSLRISTRRGMAPQPLIIGLLIEEADSVSKAAAAEACRFRFSDLRKLSIGSNAPASTILILFLQDKTNYEYDWIMTKLSSKKLINTVESEIKSKKVQQTR